MFGAFPLGVTRFAKLINGADRASITPVLRSFGSLARFRCWLELAVVCGGVGFAPACSRPESPPERTPPPAGSQPGDTPSLPPPPANSADAGENGLERYLAAKAQLEQSPPSLLQEMRQRLGPPAACHPPEGKDLLLCYWHFDGEGRTRVVSATVGPAEERNDSPNAWVRHVHFVRDGVADGSIEGGIMQKVGRQR